MEGYYLNNIKLRPGMPYLTIIWYPSSNNALAFVTFCLSTIKSVSILNSSKDVFQLTF